jgi:hypothetical protein
MQALEQHILRHPQEFNPGGFSFIRINKLLQRSMGICTTTDWLTVTVTEIGITYSRYTPEYNTTSTLWSKLTYNRKHIPTNLVQIIDIWIFGSGPFAKTDLTRLINYWNSQRPDIWEYSL